MNKKCLKFDEQALFYTSVTKEFLNSRNWPICSLKSQETTIHTPSVKIRNDCTKNVQKNKIPTSHTFSAFLIKETTCISKPSPVNVETSYRKLDQICLTCSGIMLDYGYYIQT